MKSPKTVLFVPLVVAVIVTLSGTVAFAQSGVEKDGGFELKDDFATRDDAKEYAKNLNEEIENQHDRVREAAERGDARLAEESERLEELKDNAAGLIAVYHPDTESLGITVDEYFAGVDNPGVSRAGHDYADAPIINAMLDGWSLVKIGYGHTCPLVPIVVNALISLSGYDGRLGA